MTIGGLHATRPGDFGSFARRLLRPATLFALRGANMFAKFLLTLYTARYLGLAELGIYGLLTAAAQMGPPVLGLGTIDWSMRKIVTLSSSDALRMIATRATLPVMMHAVLQPAAWLLNLALGTPVPWDLVVVIGLVLLLDNVTSDVQDLLIARGHAQFAYVLFFLRAGLWPFVVIALGWRYPQLRSLECILFGWLGGLIVVFATLACCVLMHGRWRHLRFQAQWLRQAISEGRPFYLKDLSASASQYLDRFLISLFLGLELTGVYTLFWSVTNVVHNLATFGIVQAQISKLIAAVAGHDLSQFRLLERRLQYETLAWSAALACAVSAAMPLLFRMIDRPLVHDNFAVYWVVLAATLMRIGADGYGFVLLALRMDVAIAVIGVCGALLSAALNLALVPTFGLLGASLAYFGTGAALLAARFTVSHREPRA
jgi:O-antigen/teichoic acid export membrane protein